MCKRAAITLIIAVVAGLTLAGAPASAAENRERRPNILIILADDMGFSDATCYGGEIETPNLDRLAANGLRFTQFYNTARCWPTRSSLLTGYYAQQIRMDPPQGRLPQWTRVLPHYLKPLGYRCYHSGKWHLNGAPKAVADGGFDHSYKLDDHDRFFSPQRHLEDDRPLPPVAPESGFYVTRAIADHAIRCLKEHAENHPDQPFFHYLAFTSPHFPIQALPEDIARYRDRYREGWDVIRERRWKRMREMGLIHCALSERDPKTVPAWNLPEEELKQRIGPGEVGRAVPWKDLSEEQKSFQALKMAIHAAMIDRMDREIGRVLKQIEAMGALEDTVIFFASDNGASAEQIIRGDGHDPTAPPGSARSFLGIGPGWSTAANTPFRLHKSWVHEGGIATPLIVHWTKGIAARGELRHDVGHVIDIVPTLLDLIGEHPSDTWNGVPVPPLPGRSLVPAFARDGAVQREFLFFSHIGNRALRIGDWKLVSTRENENVWELYDLSRDRCEMVNLAAQQPERVRQMASQWQEWDTRFRHQSGADELPPAKSRKAQ
ncbi:MAG: arylsulfatase [Isosphaeraceae bacterium]|nr:arylsulfatase [Isosphaeraceae bacterium]